MPSDRIAFQFYNYLILLINANFYEPRTLAYLFPMESILWNPSHGITEYPPHKQIKRGRGIFRKMITWILKRLNTNIFITACQKNGHFRGSAIILNRWRGWHSPAHRRVSVSHRAPHPTSSNSMIDRTFLGMGWMQYFYGKGSVFWF